MKILYGTTNKGKLQAMAAAVKPLDIELIGLNELDRELPYINENGHTPLENAEIKAKAYYEAFHMPVFRRYCRNCREFSQRSLLRRKDI